MFNLLGQTSHFAMTDRDTDEKEIETISEAVQSFLENGKGLNTTICKLR